MAQNKVTIKDIAREVGVSTALVSFVMSNKSGGRKIYRVSEETQRKVLEAAARMNYQPNVNAKALRNGETRTIGVIVSDISNKFYAKIARAISEWASEHDYTVIFGNTDENPDKLAELLDLFRSKGVDGFIIVPCENSQDTISSLQKDGIPFVLIDRDFAELEADSVLLDNEDASRQLVTSLAASGCRKIEMVSYETTLSNIKDREMGYLRGVAEAGFDYCYISRPEYGDYEQIKKIIGRIAGKGADAVLFATYRMTVLGRKAMKELGIRVPEDCRIACFSNAEDLDVLETYEDNICYTPQPIAEYAVESLDLLRQKIKGEAAPGTKILLQASVVGIK